MGVAPLFSRRALIALGALAPVAALAAGIPAAPAIAEVALAQPDGRITRYRVLMPPRGGRWGIVVFSHGAKGANTQYDRLLARWADAGTMVIIPNHLDHDGQPMPAGSSGSTLWRTRIEDMQLPFAKAADFAALARTQGGHPDWNRAAIAGHSFGGLIAQVLAGAKVDPALAVPLPLPPVRCAIAFSPPGTRPGMAPADSWSAVRMPAFLETGDRDMIPGFIDDWRQHKAGFENDPGRNRWLAIGRGVDHFFGGLICKPEPATDFAQAPALAAAADASADFLRTWLFEDKHAAARLRANAYGASLDVKAV